MAATESTTKDLVKNIKIECVLHNVTISQLEEDLHFPRGTIYKWRENSPSVDRVAEVARYFGVTIDRILKGIDTQP